MRLFILLLSVVLIGGVIFGLYLNPEVAANLRIKIFGVDKDADLPDFAQFKVDKEDYMRRRAENIAMYRGIHEGEPFDPMQRVKAVKELDKKQLEMAQTSAPQAPWVPLGPAPIPNGNGNSTIVPVSGRVISIAVHPANPDIVYVGAAQGGLYRSTDGGANWTAILDSALSLAIGAIAIAPSQPETIYVGTGEAGFCGDCFFGVGVYRIDNASSGSPVITGPLNDEAVTDADIFTGRSIGEIVVHPTDPAIIFVASASGNGGLIGTTAGLVLPARGVYRSTDATSADPSFTKLTGLAGNGNFSIRDIAIDPLNPDLLVANVVVTGSATAGIYTSVNALSDSPTFTQTAVFNSTSTSGVTAEFAVNHTNIAIPPTIYAAVGNLGGRVLRSTDGGLTWPQRVDNDFCTPQCFYDIAVAVAPDNADRVYLGGAPALIHGFSIDGGATFTNNSQTAVGVHVDTHALAVAPSNPSVVYLGTDGGIWRSNNSGSTWNNLNNNQFFATQFMGLSLHPTDRHFTIGGTQDNGTNIFQPSQIWRNTEGGDGGYTVIDQNAVDTGAVTMYHTFFNRTTAMGYSRSLNAGGSWQFFGCGFGGATPNGMTCTATGTLFYAPMERGPGNPNTLYFGSDVLYRSADAGLTMVKVSQEPIQGGCVTPPGCPVSAIGISPQDDNVRLVGTTVGGIFGTTTGANPLPSLDTGGAVPNNAIARAVVDPNNVNTAYVTLSVFGAASNVFKTTNLNNPAPTWTAASAGIPAVPVSAFVIDPQDSNALYAGTDIGVFQSLDGGATWNPFGTGLPRVAVFDAEISNVHRVLKIATHGRGIFETPIPGTGLPIARPAGNGTSGPGGAIAVVAESYPPNGAIDPGETVTVSFGVQNTGGGPTTNLVATLPANSGVTGVSGPQNYGTIPAGSSASRNFSFTAVGTCNTPITSSFQLQDGATNFGTFNIPYTLGALVTGAPTSENFDGVTTPALPAGWTTAQTFAAPLWESTTATSDTAPNSAGTGGVGIPGENSLTSPVIAIPAAPGTGVNPGVELSFRNSFDTEGGYDGGVLEISINGGAFTDIITAGGTFVTGGYNGVLGPTDHALSGRQGWNGFSNGFITTTVRLPGAAHGQNAQFRWRTAYDTGTDSFGMNIDSVSVYSVTRVCTSGTTAAPADIGGRITDARRGIRGVTIRLFNSDGTVNKTAMTNAFGYYRFRGIATGDTYVLKPTYKRYKFDPPSIVYNHLDEATDLNFTAVSRR